ncbi:hypothetical protein AB1Y20_014034 [Prymnesium parvum]|uniref:NADAR domain-containing protein n=1 Tax=Prymnesium parvum TaxID=97485 RepID=A0AB34IEZ4_PRYPA
MRPAELRQLWSDVGSKGFSLPALEFYGHTSGPHRFFSNFCEHAPFEFVIPASCDRAELEATGRSATTLVGFAEKAIMLCKAAAMHDYSSYDAICAAATPRQTKALGRSVAPWDQERWDRVVCDVAREVVFQKFSKVDGLKDHLLNTGTSVIAEMTKNDAHWGTGIDMGCGANANPRTWRGTNILGWALMDARARLSPASRPLPAPSLSPPTPSPSAPPPPLPSDEPLDELPSLDHLPSGSRVAVLTLLGTLSPITRGHIQALDDARRLLLSPANSPRRPARLEEFAAVVGVVCLNGDSHARAKLGDAALSRDERRQLVRLAIRDHSSWLRLEPRASPGEDALPEQLRARWPRLEIIHFRLNGADDVARYHKWQLPTSEGSRYVTVGRQGHTQQVLEGMRRCGVDPEDGRFVVLPDLPDISSTEARRALLAGDAAALERMLDPEVAARLMSSENAVKKARPTSARTRAPRLQGAPYAQ